VSKARSITDADVQRVRDGVDHAWCKWVFAERYGKAPKGWRSEWHYHHSPVHRPWHLSKLVDRYLKIIDAAYTQSEMGGAERIVRARLFFRLLVGRAEPNGHELAGARDQAWKEGDREFYEEAFTVREELKSNGVFEHPMMTRVQQFLFRFWDTPHQEVGSELFRFTASDLDLICHDILGRARGYDGSAMKMTIWRLRLPTIEWSKLPYSRKVTRFHAAQSRIAAAGGGF